MKITITALRFYRNSSTIRHHESRTDDKRCSTLASSKACEWALAKKCENAENDGKETQGESLDYNDTRIHTLGDKLSKLYSRFSQSCTIYLDH